MDGDDGNVATKTKKKPGSFGGLGLTKQTYKAIMKMGYKLPTPIQRKTIPTILEGADVVAMARTGSGKTAAFLIPIIERLATHSASVGVRAVVLSPTRELAMQTAKFFRQLAKFSDLRVCLLVGGQAMETQFEHLAANPDVIIATPGRLTHHMTEADLSLSRVQMLVFDEADRLFELGFAEQLQKVLESTPVSRQCLLFSATLPAQLVSFSRAGVKNPVFVRLDVETTLSDSLKLWFLYVRQSEKLAATIHVLRRLQQEGKSTIMFVATRYHVEFFGELLATLGFQAAVVYGSMDQAARQAQVSRFRHNKAKILVTTDVAARGIDIPALDHVLNFDFPPSAKLFVHRSGRTARAGRSGLAVSLVTLEDLPYTMELSVFLGCKLNVAREELQDASAGQGDVRERGPETPVLGSLPRLDNEVETLTGLLMDPESTLAKLHKTMMSSYGAYNKMRPAASKQSVGRSRQLLEECGGAIKLQGILHPAFREEELSSKSLKASQSERAFVEELRGFRPRAEKVGNVLSTDAMRTMEQAKLDSAAVTAGRAAVRAQREAARAEPSVIAGASLSSQQVTKEPPKVDKVRLSKAQRKHGKQGGDGKDAEFSGFDVKVDGVTFGGSSSSTKRPAKVDDQPAPEHFYLSVERDRTVEAKEKGLEMEDYQLDIAPDERDEIAKAKSVMRWDVKRKKYLPVMVAADGKVVKKGVRRNEAGVKVTGDAEKSNLYKKWAQKSKMRIQKVGELEQFDKPSKKRSAAEAATVDMEEPPEPEEKKRKPIVPFHGTVEEKYLTNRQKRLLKKRQQKDMKDRVITGPAKKEIKTPAQLRKAKQNKERHKLNHNPKLRRQKNKASKDAYLKKAAEQRFSQMYTRSKMLVINGEGKRRKERRPMRTV
mmetsp:Transcript_43760/g.103391  ORF Transcript_43760/g.103391 Transcript_43760/m.103391 type:complete len:885 (+) Transcript_43760:96-2750(+)